MVPCIVSGATLYCTQPSIIIIIIIIITGIIIIQPILYHYYLYLYYGHLAIHRQHHNVQYAFSLLVCYYLISLILMDPTPGPGLDKTFVNTQHWSTPLYSE